MCNGEIENSGFIHNLQLLQKTRNVLAAYVRTDEFSSVCTQQYAVNSWFTPEFCKESVIDVCNLLSDESLLIFFNARKNLISENAKNIAVVAENITPLDIFYNLVPILFFNHNAIVKINPKNSILFSNIINHLQDLFPEYKERIVISNKIANFDAIIADVSETNNDAFEKYFGKYPHLFRFLECAVAILSGNETKEELKSLSHDIYLYFGLGNYSVKKIFVPNDYDFSEFFNILESESKIISNHNQFLNNIDYQKTVNLMGKHKFLDAGTFLFRESEDFLPPIGTIFYSFYDNIDDALATISANESKISSITSNFCKKSKIKQLGTSNRIKLNEIDHLDQFLRILQ